MHFLTVSPFNFEVVIDSKITKISKVNFSRRNQTVFKHKNQSSRIRDKVDSTEASHGHCKTQVLDLMATEWWIQRTELSSHIVTTAPQSPPNKRYGTKIQHHASSAQPPSYQNKRAIFILSISHFHALFLYLELASVRRQQKARHFIFAYIYIYFFGLSLRAAHGLGLVCFATW